jgi:hypothetical protein
MKYKAVNLNPIRLKYAPKIDLLAFSIAAKGIKYAYM